MQVLVIGSGGREHALTWALSQSDRVSTIYTAPGNAGTDTLGRNVDISADSVEALRDFALENDIDLTIVGPEKPLVAGIVDVFQEADLAVVGPTAAAARLEGSKAFAKSFMAEHGIPTARHRTFEGDEYQEARSYLQKQGAPVVVKASGLAGGKGALVCQSSEEALDGLERIMKDRAFGEAGDQVVIEEFMEGEEASVFALTDGNDYVVLPTSQDHKRVGEGDTGPNTGGMGAYSPAPVVTGGHMDRIKKEIIEPTLEGMAAAGTPYQGILYCGLMITEDGPRVVEYNCRLGDPEAQVLLPRLQSDIAEVLKKVAEGRLSEVTVEIRPEATACVVLTSGGYPRSYDTGFEIEGLRAATSEWVQVFHAGTRRSEDGHILTDGGRVLGVTALGAELQEALDRAYFAVQQIHFEGMQFRRDIGKKGLVRL